MLDPAKWQEWEKKLDQDFLRNIHEYGWHIMCVGAGKTEPAFAYSTGLFRAFKQPEIVVMGEPFKLMHTMINVIGDRMKAGERFQDRGRYMDVIGKFPVEMRRVHKSWYDDYPRWAGWFYENHDWPCLQCFYPDMSGRFPWHPRCDQWAIDQQPFLFEPKRG